MNSFNILRSANIAIENLFKNSLTSILIVIGAIISKLLSNNLVKYAINRVEDNDPDNVSAVEQRAYTLGSLVRNIFNVLIYGTMFVMLLAEWGINITPILTGAEL